MLASVDPWHTMHRPAKIGDTSSQVAAAAGDAVPSDVGSDVAVGWVVGVGGKGVGVCGTKTGTVEIACGAVVMAVSSLPIKP